MTPTRFINARKALGLTQEKLAELGAQFGVQVAADARVVRRWESGEYDVPPALALLFEVLLASREARSLLGISDVDRTKLSGRPRRRAGRPVTE